ncbi:hypothetical protein CF15_06485 [Pyrodictium occultum]|uniref:Uncharacterized protein n=1 Tax=Pyrodictium occultum TaxID=2309 RepID=A0A0V8RWP1_PYROC|nr:hypothetical protein [Pyrodictium occultum]KSW12378.1 hypothetical protein CF15_06485 [Pyrodictium occultum]
MDVDLLAYEAYVVLLALLGVAAAETIFYRVAGAAYLEARVELEQLLSTYRSLRGRGDKRAQRRAGKLHSRLPVLQRTVRRYALLRLSLLTPVYAAAVIAFTIRPVLFPSACCIPALTLGGSGVCVAPSGLVAALAFLASLPVVQYDLVGVLMLKKAWRHADREPGV